MINTALSISDISSQFFLIEYHIANSALEKLFVGDSFLVDNINDFKLVVSEILDNERIGLEQELIHFSDDPEFELGRLKITINNLDTSEIDLIVCEY